MQFTKPQPHSDLEKIFLTSVEQDTPAKVKAKPLIDLNQKGEFTITLTKEQLLPFDPEGEGLGILDWFKLYEKEAKVSTAGIRGLQNPLYPWDTRYPLNFIGLMLATMGKIKVAEKKPGKHTKIATCEVRYNSPAYVELIARLQAAHDITTWVTNNHQVVPIFMISFIIFMYDLYGGEYVTSSHAMCRKIATKDLNTEGSQYIPSESLEFVDEVHHILQEIEETGSYTFSFAPANSQLIDRKFLKSINNGVDLYVDYLRRGVATPINLDYIKGLKSKIVVECMGGSMYKTLHPVVKQLGILPSYAFLHIEEDPFNHGIGKIIDDNDAFFDWSCDSTIVKTNQTAKTIHVPVVESVNYAQLLKDYPLHTCVLMTDPDADRLVTSYIEDVSLKDKLTDLGIITTPLDQDRMLVMFTPNQSFLMTVDFQQKALSEAGLWDKYDWFILKTTASQRSWDEWAKAHNIPVVNTPVGYKELADSMQVVERKLKKSQGKSDIYIKDVFGNNINLGKNPRMLFAGEESGGEVFGPSELIMSQGGRTAISMREKSAGEAVIITSAMAGWLEKKQMSMADYLLEIFESSKIHSRYEIRHDEKYYNESEPDIDKLLTEKERGMQIKTQNNSYFLSLALGLRDGLLTLEQVRSILSECFPDLDFSDLSEVKFVGDGTYFLFANKCLEVRPSGTDAINKAYSYGLDQWECIKYAQHFSSYQGQRTPLHEKLIPAYFYDKIEDYAFQIYSDYKLNQ